MSRFISRANAARVIVLLVVAIAAVSWAQLAPTRGQASPSLTEPRAATVSAAADAPPVQTELPGAALAPAAAPPAQPVPTARHRAHARRGHGRHPHARRARAGRAHHRSHARRAHPTRPRNPWLSSGGRDIGWPQCPPDVGFRGHNGLGQPMPDEGVQFVIIGLTNGRSFTPNPCLDRHLAWVRSHHVLAAAYAFAAYPSRSQLRRFRHLGPYDGRYRLGALANAGHATARYNIATMQAHGFTTPHVWLDVEPSSTNPWSHSRSRNRAVVRGWVRGYRDAGYTVGIYSTSNLWRSILGPMRLRLPEWRTAGPVAPRAALGRCSGQSIQGGRAVISQWWTEHRDFDRICPDASATMAQYFHKW